MNSLQKAFQLGSRLVTIGARNPKRLSHVLGSALWASDDVIDSKCDLLSLPTVEVNELLPQSDEPLRVQFAYFPNTFASVSVLEFNCLVLLMKRVNARQIFEFGTFRGISITQLVLNLPPGSKAYTLDLPDQTNSTLYNISDPEEVSLTAETSKGSLVPRDLRDRVTFLKQDSGKFDESPYAGQIDFVFVDGAHSYDYVKNDSEKGWRMLRSGGVMAWHDVRPADPDVVRYLLECSFKPSRISGTSLAYAQKP